MQTPQFAENLQLLEDAARADALALMCAEAVPWRCHRSLLADALAVRGYRVHHILSATRSQPHAVRAWARVEGTNLTYPPESAVLGVTSCSKTGT